LRRFFEVDASYIAFTALYELVRDGKIDKEVLEKAAEDLSINPDKLNPRTS